MEMPAAVMEPEITEITELLTSGKIAVAVPSTVSVAVRALVFARTNVGLLAIPVEYTEDCSSDPVCSKVYEVEDGWIVARQTGWVEVIVLPPTGEEV